VEEATPSFWAISAIRVVRICCTSLLLVSDLATSAAGLNPGLTASEAAGINCATAAQRYAQQRSPNQPMTVRLMLSVVVRDENDSPPKTPKPESFHANR
jgi:hypothetical protein